MGFFGGGSSVDLASPPAIGSTTPNTGKFTTLEATTSLQISTSGFLFGGTNLLEQRNSTSAQTFRLYNTFTDSSNYERGFIRWNSNVLEIGTEVAGTGTARNLRVLLRNGFVGLANSGNSGFGTNSDGSPAVFVGGNENFQVSANQITLSQNGEYAIAWSASAAFLNDTFLRRDLSADTLAMRRGSNAQTFRLYNTYTSSTNFERLNFRWASNEFILDAQNGSGGGTLRGIKIGSATTSLLGFYGVTPVDQPATVADPAGGGTIDTEARTAINAIIDRLQELGLIA